LSNKHRHDEAARKGGFVVLGYFVTIDFDCMKSLILKSTHSAKSSQAERLKERRIASIQNVKVCGTDFVIGRGVYETSIDTELMVETVVLNRDETFMEVGCGSGAVSILRCAKL
jgi:methylase of polypeptide subunit release factors